LVYKSEKFESTASQGSSQTIAIAWIESTAQLLVRSYTHSTRSSSMKSRTLLGYFFASSLRGLNSKLSC